MSSGFPNMKVWHGRPLEEVVGQLRDAAIAAGARPAVVASIDELLVVDVFADHDVIDALDVARFDGGQEMLSAALATIKSELGFSEAQAEQLGRKIIRGLRESLP